MTKHDRFRPLYQKHYRRVVGFFKRAFHLSEEDSQDLAQETFTRVFEGLDEYRGDAEWAYLEEIARNVAYNKIRSQNTMKRSGRVVDLDDPDIHHQMPVTRELDYVDREQKARMYEEIERLAPGQRQVVTLFLQGFKYHEIARVLRITPDAVKSRLRDARKTLRERLGDVNGLPEDES